MRRPLVAGNWKMHGTIAEATRLAADVSERLANANASDVDVVLCPPFTALAAVRRTLEGAKPKPGLGAQNAHWEQRGAFTGEISVPMLADLGCAFVLVGHSERRTLFHETDAIVNRKARAVLDCGLTPIVCVGESLAERESGATEAVLRAQLEGSLAGIGQRLRDAVVAYEPVWAIGTGRNATPEQAQAAHRWIRTILAELAGADVAGALRIQYGGSLKPANAAELFAQPDVDGGLVGGASLDAAAFAEIVRAAARS